MAIRLRQGALIGTALIIGAAALGVARWLAPAIDVGAVRAALAADSRGAFDLLVALRGRDGGPDWAGAERICRDLAWPRCDRAALERLLPASGAAFADRKNPGPTAALAAADATWALGSEGAARKMFRVELDRIPDTDGPGRARVFLRFGIIDTNPDGQAALFAQACAADAGLCDRERMKATAQREVQARLVPPGNVLPLYFGDGRSHPPIAGPR